MTALKCHYVPSARDLLENPAKLRAFQDELARREMEISALNCSGNPLVNNPMGKAHSQTIHETAQLAGKLGVKTIVTMSGLPEGKAGDVTPNWITSTISWPEFEGVNYMVEAVKYQWEVAAQWWTEYAQFAKDNGVERIAIEEFPCQLVHNVRSLKKLVAVVGSDLGRVIGMNLDPSHLMIQGAEPIAAARTWNYVAVGCGRDLQWWKEFFSVCRMMGYDGYVSLEMEDMTMSVESGLQTSIDALNQTISR